MDVSIKLCPWTFATWTVNVCGRNSESECAYIQMWDQQMLYPKIYASQQLLFPFFISYLFQNLPVTFSRICCDASVCTQVNLFPRTISRKNMVMFISCLCIFSLTFKIMGLTKEDDKKEVWRREGSLKEIESVLRRASWWFLNTFQLYTTKREWVGKVQ